MPKTLRTATPEPAVSRVEPPLERVDGSGGSVPGARVESGYLWRDVALVTALALAVRLTQLDRAPQFDELYHVIAARSWATDGTLALGGGTYTRAAAFTIMIGLLFKVFGVSLIVARVPSILAGAAWVAAVHHWTGRKLGRWPGLVTGVLFALDPGSIYLSQFARFYALQGLCAWIGAMCVYRLIEERPTGAAALRAGAGALVSLGVAIYLQVTTLIGAAGLGVWAAWRLLDRRIARARHARRLGHLLVVLLAALVMAMVIALATGVAGKLWSLYRQTPIWGEPYKDDWAYYSRWFLGRYPVLWGLLPLAAVTALLASRRVAAFALTVFAVSMAIFSGGAMKTERYIYFVIPFFFAIWGVTLVTWVTPARRMLASVVDRLGSPDRSPRARRIAIWSSTLLGVGWLLLFNPAFAITTGMVLRDQSPDAYLESDWARAAPELRRLADSADVVVSTALPKTLFYVGRADVTLSLTELGELGRRDGLPIEFNRDPRTGHPAISTPSSLQRLMGCFPRGVIFIEDRHWHDPVVVPDSTRAFLAVHTAEVPLPPAWRVHARRWTAPAPTPGASCPPWQASQP
jgi:4-amino-4-deoxy-L-arabinose transferase-like glycosyltransferase